MQDNVINIMPYLEKREKERQKELQEAESNVFDLIEDLSRYVNAYQLTLN